MRYRAIQEALQDAQFRQAIGVKGKDEVPATWVQDASDWSAEDRQAFIVLDNSPEGVSGEWDWDLLANTFECEELNAWGLEVPTGEEYKGNPDGQAYDESTADGVFECKCPTCGHKHASKN